ncbi:MAG: hypothetical protein WEG56_09370 [Chloroflexota bacterium]
MSTHVHTPAIPFPRALAGSRQHGPVALVAGVGGAMAVAGSALPWLSLYAGLQPISGLEGLNGRILMGLGLIALALSMAHLIRGGTTTRWLLAVTGFAIVALGGWLVIQMLQAAATTLADPLLVARIEPGLPIAIIGGSLVFATVFAPMPGQVARPESRPASRLSAMHLALVAALLLPGLIHIVLAPEHLQSSIALGLGFGVTGAAQVAIAWFVLRRRSRGWLVGALAVSLFSVAALVAAVTVGLSLAGHGEATGLLGPVEVLDDVMSLTGIAEAAAVVLAARLLRTRGADAS